MAPGKGSGKAKLSWKPDPGVYALLKEHYADTNLKKPNDPAVIKYNLYKVRLENCIERLILPLINVLYLRSCSFPPDNEPYANVLDKLLPKVTSASITSAQVDAAMSGYLEVVKPNADLDAETLKHDQRRKADKTYEIPPISNTKTVPFSTYAADLNIIFFPQESKLSFVFPAKYNVKLQVHKFMLQTASQTVGQGIVKVLESCMKGDGRDMSSDSTFPMRSLSSVLDDVRSLTSSLLNTLSSLKDIPESNPEAILNKIIRPAMKRSFLYTSISPRLLNTACPTSSIHAGYYETEGGH